MSLVFEDRTSRIEGYFALRILVVDDEETLRTSIAQSLREEGYAVDEASNGIDADCKAMALDYDLVLLDWMLPGMSGIDLLKKLRLKRSMPVLLLTARDSIQDRVVGLDLGADDYLVKPFSLSELHARIRALIRRSAGHASNNIVAGQLTLDLGAKTVQYSGKDIVLTAREYSLLELLAIHKGKVVTRTLIYDHIFDDDDDSLSNIVDVHISHLRKKLSHDLIETRRGQGYILHG